MRDMKIRDVVTLVTQSISPETNIKYHLYSLPSYDENQTREELLGTDIQSNKYSVPNKCILFNKLNVRFKRIWAIDNLDENKLCSTEFLPLVVDESKIDFNYCFYLYSLKALLIIYVVKILIHREVTRELTHRIFLIFPSNYHN